MTTQASRSPMKLEDLLLRHGAITPEQLAKAKQEQSRWGGDLGRIFVDLGYIREELLLRATAHQQGVRFVDPLVEEVDPEVVRALSVQLCEQFGVIAVAGDPRKKVLVLATSDPLNTKMLGHLTAQTGFQLEVCAATSASIQAAIRRHFYGEGSGEAIDLPPEDAGAASVVPLASPVTPAPPEPGTVAAPGTLVPALPPTPAPPAPAGLAALTARLARLETQLSLLEKDLSRRIAVDPQLAGLAARLEHLEQLSANDVGSLRAVVELLLERGTFKLDDLKAKLKQVRGRTGPSST